MIDLTPIFQAFIALLAAIVTYLVIPWLKAKTTEAQREKLEAIYRIAVMAAEQLYGSGHGKDKFIEAKRIVEEAGFTFNADILEAMVYDELTAYKETEGDSQ